MKCYNCSKEISEVDICPYCEKNQIYTSLDFNVKGVTFENEEGKDIQKEIRKIFLEYERNGVFEKYSGYTNKEIKEFVNEVAEFEDAEIETKLEEDTFEGKPCVKIYIKRYDNSYCHVGYMPKGLVKQYLKLKKHFKEIKMSINLVGGKIKQLEYDYDTNKEKVVVVELTYGFEVSLIFYNDLEKYKIQIEKKKKETMERYRKILQEDEEKNQEERRKEIEEKNNLTKLYRQMEEKAEKERELEQERRETMEFQRRQNELNIKLALLIIIVSIPFVWILWKIFSFVIWLLF